MKFLRLFAAVLALFCLTSCGQPKVPDDALVFLACSDLQRSSGHETAIRSVQSILDEIRDAGYDRADGAFFCGDYSWDFDDSVPGLNSLRTTVRQEFTGIGAEDIFVVQGNHDPSDTPGLSAGGGNDRVRADGTVEFGVYILHEDDYMWHNTRKQVVIDAAERLKTYLDEKIEQNYTGPIFVLAHLPLHYSMRTYLQNDARYACYLFDVLNDAGEAGLNIFYLFGHNHSKGWDDYLGGSAVYLAKGDTLPVAQSGSTVFEEETLTFTYLNAGYVGYYHNVNAGAETDLTMTVFQITDDAVTIERYTADGLHDLKSPGVSNTYLDEQNLTSYNPDPRTYPSPQTVVLNKEITP